MKGKKGSGRTCRDPSFFAAHYNQTLKLFAAKRHKRLNQETLVAFRVLFVSFAPFCGWMLLMFLTYAFKASAFPEFFCVPLQSVMFFIAAFCVVLFMVKAFDFECISK